MEQLFIALHTAGHKSFDPAVERLVALLRVALATLSLVVVPMTSGLGPQLTILFEGLLGAYVLFGLSVVALATFGRLRTGWQLPVHIIDIGFISILLFFVQRLSMTFFTLYLFVLLSATFRWNSRGAFWTIITLLSLQVPLLFFTGATALQLTVQWAFILIVGGVFVFFGVSRERNSERLIQIAAWPKMGAQSYLNINEHWLDASLIHIANVLTVPRVLVLWEISQEPYCYAAHFANDQCQYDRTPADGVDNLVTPELEHTAFATDAIESNECLTSNGTKLYVGPIIKELLRDRFRISSVCSASFSGDLCKGRVFMLDRPHWREDDLMLAEIVASRLRVEFEYYAISLQLQETAASRERMRLAHDLHDGVLQSLAAAGLQLTSIASHSRQTMRRKLDNIRKLLFGEQQRIRAFVERRQPSPREPNLNVRDEIQREIEKIKRQWGRSILLTVTPLDAMMPSEFIRQIALIIAEAIANAVQHGDASRINVKIEKASDCARLHITDNGLGLKGITGKFSQYELDARGIGPRSIFKRVADLRGDLSLSSSSNGVEISIAFPPDDRIAAESNEKKLAFG
jgi:signal transduction histidine kinase